MSLKYKAAKGLLDYNPPVQNSQQTSPYQNDNSEVMAALLDIERFRNNDPSWDMNHAMNPNKIPYLNVKEVDGTASAPGLGADGVYRDPWGNPYIYRYPGQHNSNSYDLYSAGPDLHDGTDDDVTNWK